MANESSASEPRADLQTAQNRMFSFVGEALNRREAAGEIATLLENPTALKAKHEEVRRQLFDLLCLPEGAQDGWHIGIADSGKRTIELLVNFLCPGQEGKNAIVDTENYVGYNKFSAAKALEKQKGVAFETPFNIALGHALTINADEEVEKLERLLGDNRFDTLWLSWNSTSTGIRERIGQVVQRRNAVGSKTLIVADAASLRLFSNEWNEATARNLPDVFFFSLRKQGLPYDGPNDEFHQAQNSGALIVFNDRALERVRQVGADTIYDSPTFAEFTQGRITPGEQRANHVRHLLKLDCALAHFMDGDRERLAALDKACNAARSKIREAFATNGNGSTSRFSLFSDPAAQSNSAYILNVPATTSAKKVISSLKEEGVLISACMHPKMDGQRYVRFAFYPGNTTEEVDYLLERIGSLA